MQGSDPSPDHPKRRSDLRYEEPRERLEPRDDAVAADEDECLEETGAHGTAGHGNPRRMHERAEFQPARLGDRAQGRLGRRLVKRLERAKGVGQRAQVVCKARRFQVLVDGGRVVLLDRPEKRDELRREVAKPPGARHQQRQHPR